MRVVGPKVQRREFRWQTARWSWLDLWATDLAKSAKGTLHFDWKKGAIAPRIGPSTDAVPSLLGRFDHWTGDAEIADGGLTLKENHVQQGMRSDQ